MPLAEKFNISEKDYIRFFGETTAFSWGFLQDVVTFLRAINERGFTIDFAVKCILIRKENNMAHVKMVRRIEDLWKERGLKCAKCGGQMFVEPVNTGPGDQLPGGWRSIWRCLDITVCGHEELSKKSVGEWIKKLGLDFRRVMPGAMAYPVESLPEEFMNPKGPEFPEDEGGS